MTIDMGDTPSIKSILEEVGQQVTTMDGEIHHLDAASLQAFCSHIKQKYEKYKEQGFDALSVSMENDGQTAIWTPIKGKLKDIKRNNQHLGPVVLLDLHAPFPEKEILAKETFSNIQASPYTSETLEIQHQVNLAVAALK